MSLHGKFFPKNPHKYMGSPDNIVYRSAWERTFMEYCDRRDDVLQWASEEIIVPYYFVPDGKWHRYYPDFFVKVQTKTQGIQCWLVEVKPIKQTRKPAAYSPKTKRRQLRESAEFAKNQAKWQAANAFCQQKGWKFVVLTEKDLYPSAKY